MQKADAQVLYGRSQPSIRRQARLIALVVGLILLLSACGGGVSGGSSPESADTTTAQKTGDGTVAEQTTAASEKGSEQAMAVYTVPTITCPSCVARVEANAKKESGVIDAKADLSTQKATVTYDPEETDPRKIADAIREGGDTVQPEG